MTIQRRIYRDLERDMNTRWVLEGNAGSYANRRNYYTKNWFASQVCRYAARWSIDMRVWSVKIMSGSADILSGDAIRNIPDLLVCCPGLYKSCRCLWILFRDGAPNSLGRNYMPPASSLTNMYNVDGDLSYTWNIYSTIHIKIVMQCWIKLNSAANTRSNQQMFVRSLVKSSVSDWGSIRLVGRVCE